MESITKQLVNIGHGMSREIAADEPAVAKLLVELSSALDVQYERANALEAKCAELAAENSAVKAMNDCLSEELRGYESDGAFEGPKMHLLWWKAETPVTDAFLAEVRAQGVDALAKTLEGLVAVSVTRSYITEFAAQLRQGGAV